MNKKISIWGLAIAALFASCSNDDNVSGGNIDHNIGNSDVKIKLATGSGASTRASIESDEFGTFEANGLGIFCLAKGSLGVNPTELPIDWTPGVEATEYSVWMDNVESDAVYNEDTTSTDIVWTDGITRYYPTGNWHSYRFYGYYPYQSSINATATQRNVDFVIDGTQDIIWGKTDVSDDSLAYCAKFFRDPIYKDVTPSITFKHKLMRFTFSTVPGVDGNGSIEPALKMGIESIAIKSVPTTANLIIADKANKENEGVITFDWNNNLSDFTLLEADDQPLGADYWVQSTETRIGGGILLPVPVDPNFRYYVDVVLKDKSGNIFQPEHPMEIRNSQEFEEGKSYNIRMTINGPKEIEVKATLNAWIEDDKTIGGLEF
jgi:hypothetical protein